MRIIQNSKFKIQKIRTKYFSFCSFILIFAFCFLNYHFASAAVLYSQAANQDVYVGQTFVVDWFIDSEGQSINTVDLKLDYSKDTLDPVDMTAGNSVVSLWLDYPKAADGVVELTGGIPNGVQDSRIPVFRSVFRAKSAGTAYIKLDPNSAVLRNDGSGTSDLLKFKNLEFTVIPSNLIPETIQSTTHPDQNSWYRNRHVVIQFAPKSDVDYSYSFSSNIEIIPDDAKDEIPAEISYDNLNDGIYYFKINSKVGPSNWQEVGVYRIQIDATSPEEFTPTIGVDPAIYGGKPFLSFSTVDKTSGISHYIVKTGLFSRYKNQTSPYQLARPWVGDTVTVKAYDNAGNFRTETIPYQGYLSVRWFEVILGVIVGFCLFAFRKQIFKKQK